MKTRVRQFLMPTAVLALFCASAQAADYPATVSGFNPLGYWRLNETTASPPLNKVANSGSVGSAGDGYAVLDVIKGQPGVIGSSARFNNPGGSVGYCGSKIDVPFNAALNPNAPFSVEMWVKPNDTGVDNAGISDSPLACFDPNGFGAGNRTGWLFYLNHAGIWQFRLGLTSGYAAICLASGGNAANGVWQHIVATYDGTTVRLYANGVQIGSVASGSGWVPNKQMALRMGGNFLTGNLGDGPWISGASTSGNRGFDGWLDEVAIYPTALPVSTIAAHYDAGKPTGGTNVAGYAAQVLTSSPLGYWHLDEPVVTPPDPATFPIAVNAGTLGSAADGTNMWGTLAGQPDAGYAGLGAGNKATFLDGENGSISIKDAPGLHFSGNITMMAWVKPGAKDYYRDILARGWNDIYAETFLRISRSDDGTGGGTPQNFYELGVSDGSDATYYDVALYEIPPGDFGNWVHLAGTYDGANWNLYRNGSLVASTASTHGALDTTNNWTIGSRFGPPSPTGFFAGQDGNAVFAAQGLFFGGSIDEPAVFSTALSAADINTIYNSAQVSPVITRAVVNPGTVFKGSGGSFSVWAEGSPSLSYLWLSNGVSLGVTTTNLTISSFAVGNPTIEVAVSNPYGSVTSSVSFAVIAAAPSFVQQPLPAIRYNGRPFTFSVAVSGSTPLSLQWKTNGVAIPGATATNYSDIASAALDGVSFSCTASNEANSAVNSTAVTLTVLPLPAGYAGAVVADNPTAYWRLGETSGTVAHDFFNGNDGTYNLASLGQPGYSELDPDNAVAFSGLNSHVANISGTSVNFQGHRNFSIEAWVNGSEGQADEATIIAKGIGSAGTSPTEQFSLDVSGGRYHFYTRGGSAAAIFEAFSSSGPDGTWQHIVGVYDDLNVLGSGTNLYIFVNGTLEGQGATRANGLRASSDPVSIGSKRGGNDPGYNATFGGIIDEVAAYPYAMSNAQIVAHYSAAYGTSLKPTISKEPVSQTYYESFPAKITVGAFGTQPLIYQWHKGNVDLTDGGTISGASTRTLTIDPVTAADAGTYSVTINNTVGPATNSVTVSLTVLKAPTNAVNVPGLVLHLPFNTDLNDTSGRGNNGTGTHITFVTNSASGGYTGATNTVSPSAGNPDFNFVSDGVVGKALHYASYTTSGSNVVAGGAMTNSHYVSLGDRADLHFGANVNFSVAYWIRFPAFNGNGDLGDLPFFCSAVNSYGGAGFTFAPSYNLGSWSYSLNGNVQLYGPQFIIDDGAWHHLVHTFNRATLATTYLDGRQVDVRSDVADGNLDTGNSVSIGQDPTGSYQEQGAYDIDDFGVWRRALTSLEVQSIYLAATNALSTYVDITPSVTKAAGGQITITWQAGTLQEATTVNGPYTDVSPQPTSPFTPPVGGTKFYRTRWLQ